MLPIFLILLCLVRLGSSGVPSFNPQTSYQYEYILDLQVANAARSSIPQTWLQVHANVETHLLWRNQAQPEEQLVHVQINNFTLINKLREIPDKKEDNTAQHKNEAGKSNSLMLPILFHWQSGKVISLYSTEENNKQVLDLKRGLVSLFQFQPQPGIYSEEDVSGRCQVTYNVSEEFIYKTKDLSSCIKSPFGHKADHKVFQVSQNSFSRAYLLLNGTTFQKAVSQERYNLSANLGSLLGTHITSRQQLELMSSKPGPPEIVGESIEVVLGKLPEKYHKVPFQSHPPRLSEDTSLLKKYLETSKRKKAKLTASKISTVNHFYAVVKTFQHAKKRDIQQILQSASPDLLPFFIDAAVAAQSHATLSSLSTFLDFTKKKQIKLQEKFLYSAAFAPHPSTELLNLVLEKLKGKVSDPAIMETGIIITGAIIGKLCRADLCEHKDVELAKVILLEGLNNAEDETEMKTYLLALKNAQLPETIPTLLQYAEEHTGVVCSTALSALQAFPPHFLSFQRVKDTMKSIFHQAHQQYDKKSRLMAAETLLLADCSLEDLKSISAGLVLLDMESSKLLISKLHNRLTLHHPLNKTLSKGVFYRNYWDLSKAGRSTVFSGLLTATDEMASTYGLDLLFTESGLLKRSVSEITLFDRNHHLKTLQVTIEAQGLESLMGNDELDEEGEDASVGMSAVLFGVQLRPVVFFQGYMNLMSKVLSSSGEPTSVVKGNVLLVDYLQWLPMQSGLQVIVQYQVGLGLDISANIDVSIWDQQSKTNLNTKAGLVLELKTEIDAAIFRVDMKAQVDAESTVNFDTMMTFTNSPVSMCIELHQDDLPYRETYIITESFPEANTTHTVRKGRKSTVWGRDFPFHHANSEMCRQLKAEEEVVPDL
ncbi:PREDICTED: microsomal triglyceride transfer protein large subunit-like [Nanorana parkeri]|uniref:microsomal triglyceride transfer protein large subunit-like n=1 Tax=Nanorana parkeri TaxID=125878 RepID=UPI000854EC68|nr:PREDICTED: microsomal triglyceride transfer protein large subunit-like [Nanorana parkeri]